MKYYTLYSINYVLYCLVYVFYKCSTIYSPWNSLCAQGHFHCTTCLGLIVPVKGNYKPSAYKGILYSCVLQGLLQMCGEVPHIGVTGVDILVSFHYMHLH